MDVAFFRRQMQSCQTILNTNARTYTHSVNDHRFIITNSSSTAAAAAGISTMADSLRLKQYSRLHKLVTLNGLPRQSQVQGRDVRGNTV